MMTSIGYPYPVVDYSDFIDSVSPGIRFLRASEVIRELPKRVRDELLADLATPSEDAYRATTTLLSRALGAPTPLEVAQRIAVGAHETPAARRLVDSSAAGRMDGPNASVAYIFGRHLAFMKDRATHSHVFCWPAYYHIIDNARRDSADDARRLLSRCAAPFLRDATTSAIGVSAHMHLTHDKAVALASSYFHHQMVYDLGTQWVASPRGFDFDYRWADAQWSVDRFREWLAPGFQAMYGCSIEDIERM